MEANVLNRRIGAVEILDDKVLRGIDAARFGQSVIGRTITTAGRRGKQMFIGLDDASFLTIHLGMTGSLEVNELGVPPDYARIAFHLDGGMHLYYSDQRKFGALGIVGSVDSFVTEHRLGPDALCLGLSDFIERVSTHKKSIKSVLLDQSVISGIGNLYADEVLFQARLHPSTRADSISRRKLGELHRHIGTVLRQSIAVSTDFSALPDRYMLKVRAEGVVCPRGNGRMAMIKVGGRTTIFCPACQRL